MVKENSDNIYRELEDKIKANSFYKSEIEKMSVEMALKNRLYLEKL
jgi:hypothetical protein